MSVLTEEQLKAVEMLKEASNEVIKCENRAELKKAIAKMQEAHDELKVEELPSLSFLPSNQEIDEMEEGGLSKMCLIINAKADEYAEFILSYNK